MGLRSQAKPVKSGLPLPGPESGLYSQYEQKVSPRTDLIGSLRTLGAERDLAPATIAVIGDQSWGRSSCGKLCRGRPPQRQW